MAPCEHLRDKMVCDLRAAVHAKISERSLAGWHAFADQHGTTVSALIEVIGLELGDLVAGTAPDGPEPGREDRIGTRARELSQARKRRRPDPKKRRRRRPD